MQNVSSIRIFEIKHTDDVSVEQYMYIYMCVYTCMQRLCILFMHNACT